MQTRNCVREGCGNEYTPKTHNQKYCSDECCRQATNAKIMDRYYRNRARLAGKKRICKEPDCETRLSRYNDSEICQSCQSKKSNKVNKDLLTRLGFNLE